MGPSGCGKTTLLGEILACGHSSANVGMQLLQAAVWQPACCADCARLPARPADTLAGRLAHTAKHTGDIRVNGHKSKLSFGRSAYVTQDDAGLIGTLTVFEVGFGGQTAGVPGRQAGAARPSPRRLPALHGALQVGPGQPPPDSQPLMPAWSPPLPSPPLPSSHPFTHPTQCIMYSAKLRLPQALPAAEKRRIVDEVIAELGLESTRVRGGGGGGVGWGTGVRWDGARPPTRAQAGGGGEAPGPAGSPLGARRAMARPSHVPWPERVLAVPGADAARPRPAHAPQSTYIGTWHLRGVSGGQRRRVSIGCELVTSPKLIFL